MNKIIQRILSKLGQPELINQLAGLSQSDLNSLLLEVSKAKTDKLTPVDLLKSYRVNRFVKPSQMDVENFYLFEAEISRFAKAEGIEPVLLSPVAPLGSCSTFGFVDQNKVVSATRACEVLPDSSNMLAIYLADRLGNNEADNEKGIHVCSLDRVIRAQSLDGPGQFPHFGVFCMVSSGKDTGSYSCEVALLKKQLSFYRTFFKDKFNADMSVVLRMRKGYTDMEGFYLKMLRLMQEELPGVNIKPDRSDPDNQYYKGINYKIYIHIDNETIEIGDGGFTDWTQKMLGSKKERCLISGIGVERLLLINKTIDK